MTRGWRWRSWPITATGHGCAPTTPPPSPEPPWGAWSSWVPPRPAAPSLPWATCPRRSPRPHPVPIPSSFSSPSPSPSPSFSFAVSTAAAPTTNEKREAVEHERDWGGLERGWRWWTVWRWRRRGQLQGGRGQFRRRRPLPPLRFRRVWRRRRRRVGWRRRGRGGLLPGAQAPRVHARGPRRSAAGDVHWTAPRASRDGRISGGGSGGGGDEWGKPSRRHQLPLNL